MPPPPRPLGGTPANIIDVVVAVTVAVAVARRKLPSVPFLVRLHHCGLAQAHHAILACIEATPPPEEASASTDINFVLVRFCLPDSGTQPTR